MPMHDDLGSLGVRGLAARRRGGPRFKRLCLLSRNHDEGIDTVFGVKHNFRRKARLTGESRRQGPTVYA